jgi:hypothetical protein
MCEISFARFMIQCRGGKTAERRVHVIEQTEHVLGVQLEETIEGDVYLPIHVPTTALMQEEWGFLNPSEARAALIRFWERLDATHRSRLRASVIERHQADIAMFVTFHDEWLADADVRIVPAGRDC